MTPPLLKDLLSKFVRALSTGEQKTNSIETTIKTHSGGTQLPMVLCWEHFPTGYMSVQLSVGNETPCGMVLEDNNSTPRLQQEEGCKMVDKLCLHLVGTPSNVFGEGLFEVLLTIMERFVKPPEDMQDVLLPDETVIMEGLPKWYDEIVSRLLHPFQRRKRRVYVEDDDGIVMAIDIYEDNGDNDAADRGDGDNSDDGEGENEGDRDGDEDGDDGAGDEDGDGGDGDGDDDDDDRGGHNMPWSWHSGGHRYGAGHGGDSGHFF